MLSALIIEHKCANTLREHTLDPAFLDAVVRDAEPAMLRVWWSGVANVPLCRAKLAFATIGTGKARWRKGRDAGL